MSTSNLSLWINPQNNTISSGITSLVQARQVVLTQGDDVFIDMHMIESSGGQSVEIPFPANSSIKCAIGRIDKFPTSGSFLFQYESDSVQIPVSSSIESVNSLINGLPSIISAGGVIVYFVNSTTYRIVFNTVGAKSDCSVNTSNLYPNSNATVTRITTGTVSLNEVQSVKLKTNPVAYSGSFTLAPTPSISIIEITTSIFRVNITDVLKYGNFTISNGTKTTAAISWESSASEVLDALTACGISSTSNSVGSIQYLVTKNDTLSWDISRVGGSYETLSVSPVGFIGFSTMTGSLNLNTIEVEDLLSGAARVNATLEIELTAGPVKQTLYQGEIVIANDLIDNAVYEPIQLPSGGGGISDAPTDGLLYGRLNGNWSVVPETDLTGYATEFWVGSQGYVTINGWGTVPDGGLTGQVLTKLSDDNYMLAWTSLPDLSGYATQSWVTSQSYITSSALAPYATLASPAFSGVPTAPTAIPSDNSTTIATTAYVTNAVASSTTSPSTQKVVKTVRNATASIIPARSVVYINGANGTHPTIVLAQANIEQSSFRTFGITESSIPVDTDGIVVIIGEVSSVDTGMFNDGDQLYLSPSIAGGITNIKPSAPDHLVYVGVCTRANNNNGSIEVKIMNGFELNELHDVAIATKLNNQIIAYEQATNLWKNKSAATLGIAELSGATFLGKLNTVASTALSAGFNIGAGVAPSSPIAGDLWMTSGGNNLNYRSPTSQTLSVATHQLTNTFSAPQVIDTTSSTLAGLRVTQKGTAPALVIEDGTPYPNDTSAFVVNADGRVGVNVNPSSFSSTYELAVNGFISSNTAAIKTNNSTVANTSFVKTSAVPTVVSTLETNYVVSSLLGWKTMVRVFASSNTTIQVNADNISNLENGTKIMFLHEGSSVITFVPNGCSIISRDSMRTINGYAGVATLMKIGTDQWVVYGDLAHAPYGFVYSSACVQSEAADYAGTMWSGYFVHQTVIADGVGGTITSGFQNTNGCWHPYGWVYDIQNTAVQTLSWDASDNQSNIIANGIFAYESLSAYTFADGNGGTTGTGVTSYAQSGQVIYNDNFYDSSSGSTYWYSIIYDGVGGYYQSNSTSPP